MVSLGSEDGNVNQGGGGEGMVPIAMEVGQN